MKAFPFLVALLAGPLAVADDASIVSPAKPDDQGWLVHEVESPYQAAKTQIRVLLPDELRPGQQYRTIYILPVEAGNEDRYGDGLLEAKKLNLHNKHRVILAAPTFSHLPWYADHPMNLTIRQESYFLEVVLPFVEKSYPAQAKAEGRLLLGFSKSGWGAWTMLLRHPDIFGKAAAWDSPMMMDRYGKYGNGDIFGTQDNFEKYRVTDLLRTRADLLGGDKRLILTGYGSFRKEHEEAHALLDELKIPHEYRDGPSRKHDWHSGWVEEEVELLVENR